MTKGKKLLAVLLLLAMSLSLFGNAVAEDKKLTIGFSLPSLNFPFYVRMYDTFIAECEARGWDYQFVDGNLDSATQLSGCNDLINRKIDVLVMATWWIDAMQDVFDQCEQQGIQVYLMDNMGVPDVAKNAITFTTGTDNYNAGWVGGAWASDYFKGIGQADVSVITVRSNNEMPTKRCNGFVDGLKANGINVTLLQEYDAGERPKAMTVVEDALVAHSKVDVIFGASAQDSLGAYDACMAANRTEVLVFGFDGEDDEIKLIDGKGQYLATVTQDPAGMAKLVAEKIQAHFVDGQDIDQIFETPAGVYCADGQQEGADVLKDKVAP